LSEEPVVFARKASGLVREMNWWDVLLISIAGPAAAGMSYYTVKEPGLYPGGSIVLSFFIGGIVWLPVVICVAAIASSFPRSGSMYVMTSRVLHPMFGFMPNWMYVIGGGGGMLVGLEVYMMFILIASGFSVCGQLSGVGGSIGTWLGDPYHRLIPALILLGVLWLVELIGLSRLKWVLRVLIYIPLVVTAIALIFFFVKDGQASFDGVYGAGMAAKVQALAQAKGIKDSMVSLWPGTLNMLLAVFWAYSGLEVVSFMGSEIKSPRTSFLRGMIVGWAAVMVLYVLNAWAVGYCFGSTFVRDYAWLYYNHQGDLDKVLGTSSAAPSIPFYAAITAGSAWFSVLLAIGFGLWLLNTAMIFWMAATRGIFAMAFDRQLPLSLAKVSKTGNPTNAAHFIGVWAVIGMFISLMDSLGTGFAGNVLALMDYGSLFFVWPLGLAAMFLPYYRTDLFEKSTFQYRWAGIPAITVIGAITFSVGLWMMFQVGLELSTTWSEILVTVTLLIGLILVAVMYARNRKEGIDPGKIFTQIPPA
jgi:amino acid transporter